MTSISLKLCRNCHFVKVSLLNRMVGDYDYARCGLAPTPANAVTGKSGFDYADSQRRSGGACGPTAKHWTAK